MLYLDRETVWGIVINHQQCNQISNIKEVSDLASGAAKAAAARKEARIIAFMLRLSGEVGQVKYVYTPYNTPISNCVGGYCEHA